jgi:hypothetical protein
MLSVKRKQRMSMPRRLANQKSYCNYPPSNRRQRSLSLCLSLPFSGVDRFGAVERRQLHPMLRGTTAAGLSPIIKNVCQKLLVGIVHPWVVIVAFLLAAGDAHIPQSRKPRR